jgi:hypothetical protein
MSSGNNGNGNGNNGSVTPIPSQSPPLPPGLVELMPHFAPPNVSSSSGSNGGGGGAGVASSSSSSSSSSPLHWPIGILLAAAQCQEYAMAFSREVLAIPITHYPTFGLADLTWVTHCHMNRDLQP